MRRLRTAAYLGILGSLLLVLGPLAAQVAPARSFAQLEISCDDFVRQEAAQALLDADASYAPTLDPDGDGVACNQGTGAEPGDVDGTPVAEPTTETAAQATPTAASSNPLRGRFGSNREDFENVYGQPVADEEEAYPIGLEYAVAGFRRVTVYYHRGYVAYITLLAERTDPWTQGEAEEIVFDFLPADWSQTTPPILTEDGDLLIPGHSPYLETRFGAATYERYGAQGELGDVYFLFRLDANNEVMGIEIGLGNNVQTPPEDVDGVNGDGDAAATPQLDAEAAAYLEDVRTQFDRLVASVDEFSRIITDPNFTTDQALFDRLVQILILWSSAGVNADRLDPPPGYEELHEAFTQYAELLAGAAVDLTEGLSGGDQASIESGGEQLQQAIELQPTIEELLAEAGA